MRRVSTMVIGVVFTLLATFALTGAASGHAGHSSATEEAKLERVLVFSKTAGFRHSSIDEGIAAYQKLGAENGFVVDATEDSAAFSDENLAKYDVVVFMSTTGDVLTDPQQAAFERFIRAGHGYAGVHAASDTEYSWRFYGDMLGAYFLNHPNGTPKATVVVEDRDEPSTSHLPERLERTDEWYNFKQPPAGTADFSPRDNGVHVLATVDEGSYAEGDGTDTTNDDHPVAWCSNFEGGRAWYTAMGHTEASFTSEEAFTKHLLGGLKTAAGTAQSDCGAEREATSAAPVTADFEKVTLDSNTRNPMELRVAPDGRVFYIERTGEVMIIKPDTQKTVMAAKVPVTSNLENGLMGIALAPDFPESQHVYLFYSQLPDSSLTQVISRFTMDGDTLDLGSEEKILTFTHQRERCCHSSGALNFGPDGSLYLATGDNTDPFESNGFTPIDERAGRQHFDAQRTSANTNELNGKFIRIKPMAEVKGEPGIGSTYTIPEGNLFPEEQDTQDKTRPEIFAMGFRNPFRFTIDEKTGWLLMGDYGPDANATNPTRGPQGSVEYNTVTKPGNYGWPYCIRNNVPYNDHDFATGISGNAFNCAAPVNDSPNNTGLRNLPPSEPADAWMGYTETDPRFGASLGTGGAPMGGPRYYYDKSNPSKTKFPSFFNKKWFIGEWNNGTIKTADINSAGDVTKVEAFARGTGYRRPMSMQFGPDGALYVIEWGSGFNGNNDDSGIYRIDYVAGLRNQRPTIKASATPTSGQAPLDVAFSSLGTSDPEGAPLKFTWDFGDGTTSTDASPSHVYTETGEYTAQLKVTDVEGAEAVENFDIVVGNTRPVVKINAPRKGQVVAPMATVPFDVTVTDAEESKIDCDDVVDHVYIGHDQHSHETARFNGCDGTFESQDPAGHGGAANVFDVFGVDYTDKGGKDGIFPLLGQADVVLTPQRKEAEFWSSTGRTKDGNAGGVAGVGTIATNDTEGGSTITGVEDGDFVSYKPVDLQGIDRIVLRVSSQVTGGRVDLVLDDADGPVVATTGDIAPTLDATTFRDAPIDLSAAKIPAGDHELFLVFRPMSTADPVIGAASAAPLPTITSLLQLNWLKFEGPGVVAGSAPTASAKGTPTTGGAPLPVAFTGTGTDPDGKPLSYAWDFGVPETDSDTSTEQNPSFTYTKAGTYSAKLTVTTAAGRTATSTVGIVVSDACKAVRADDRFDGTTLDATRWNAIVRDDPSKRVVKDGRLSITTVAGDIYTNGSPDTTRNFVLQSADRAGSDWTIQAKVMGRELSGGYEQAGLIAYVGDGDYVKLDLVSGSGTAPTGVEILSERDNAVAGTSQLQALPPGTTDVWLRLTKAGTTYSGSASFDGTAFVPLQGTVTNPMASPKFGLFTLGTTSPGANVGFDDFLLDGTTVPAGCAATEEKKAKKEKQAKADKADKGSAAAAQDWKRAARLAEQQG